MWISLWKNIKNICPLTFIEINNGKSEHERKLKICYASLDWMRKYGFNTKKKDMHLKPCVRTRFWPIFFICTNIALNKDVLKHKGTKRMYRIFLYLYIILYFFLYYIVILYYSFLIVLYLLYKNGIMLCRYKIYVFS